MELQIQLLITNPLSLLITVSQCCPVQAVLSGGSDQAPKCRGVVETVVSNIPMLILGVRALSVLLCGYNTIHKDFSYNSVTQSSLLSPLSSPHHPLMSELRTGALVFKGLKPGVGCDTVDH